MSQPERPLPDVPLIVGDLLIQARQLADAGRLRRSKTILDHVAALRNAASDASSSMPVSEAERVGAAEAREATLDQFHTRLSDGILALNDPQTWRAWLKFSSLFHPLLVREQPADYAPGPPGHPRRRFQTFKAMGRRVRRGETGIKVLAPITRRGPRLDDADQVVRDDQGRVVHRTQMVATKPVTVFDIRQTDGPPLPDARIGEAALLTGQAPARLWDGIQGLLEERGLDVRRGVDIGGPNGYTDFGGRLVMVRDDVDDAQAVKTLVHEVGHVLLHREQRSRDCRDPRSGSRISCLHGHERPRQRPCRNRPLQSPRASNPPWLARRSSHPHHPA